MTISENAAVLFAQAAAPTAAPGGMSGWSLLILYGLMGAGMYFLIIAPQNKKRKEHEKLLSTIATGDEIITTGGIYGTVANVKDDRYVVRISDNTKIEVGKTFVQALVKKSS